MVEGIRFVLAIVLSQKLDMHRSRALAFLIVQPLRQTDIPESLRPIWLIEECRSDIAMQALKLDRSRNTRVATRIALAAKHLKLWLLVRAAETVSGTKAC